MGVPNTPLLDSFNRADQGPPPSASWSQGPIDFTVGNGLVVKSGALAHAATATADAGAYWNAQQFGPDCECFATLTGNPATDLAGLYVRLASIGAGTSNGYHLQINLANTNWVLFRVDAGALTQIAGPVAQALALGDKLALQAIGSTLTAWYQPSGGSWRSVVSGSDATYGAAGFVGARIFSSSNPSTTTFDDFGGGSVSAALLPQFLPRRLGPRAVGPTFFAPQHPLSTAAPDLTPPLPALHTLRFLPRRLGPRAVGPTFFAPVQPAVPTAVSVANQASLSATLTFTGAQARAVVHLLTATVSFTGALARAVVHLLTATLSFAAALSKRTAKLLTAAVLSCAAAVSLQTRKLAASTLSFTGAQSRVAGKLLVAALSFAGTRAVAIRTALAGVLSFAGTRAVRVGTGLASTLSVTGTLSRAARKLLTGAGLTLAGALTTSRVTLKALAAALSFTGGQARQAGKALAGGVSSTGQLARATGHRLTASASFTGSTAKSAGKKLAAVVAFAATASKARIVLLSASLSPAGSLLGGFVRGFVNMLAGFVAMGQRTGRSTPAQQRGVEGVTAPQQRTGRDQPRQQTGESSPEQRDGNG